MTKEDLYYRFIEEYPYFDKLILGYKKNGKNSILVLTTTGKNLVYKVEGKKSSITKY